jgi:uncharacterized protein (DUF488 family)
VRKISESKKFPHFNKDILENKLKENNIDYIHFPQLGGFRPEGYEFFSKTDEFKNAIESLIKIIKDKTAMILCSEIDYRRCHRFFIANALEESGFDIFHIWTKENVEKHDKNQKRTLFCDKKARKFQKNQQITKSTTT